jgi:hypothetical protein
MICRIWFRLAAALCQSSLSTARLYAQPWTVKEPDKQRDHHPTDQLHDMDMNADSAKSAECHKHHPVAAGEQYQDRCPDPEEEIPEAGGTPILV